jgi:hypothetical protein
MRSPSHRSIAWRLRGTPALMNRYLRSFGNQPEENSMPLLPIILWVGVPVVLIGGGYWIVQTMQ